MRADRLVSLVLLLRQRGRMTAVELAAELEVSTRTVLRDVEALSAAGVPVHAERGRYGGFALLPGFRTELTGMSHDETLAVLTVAATPAGSAFGLGGALASAVRKVVDALPQQHRTRASDAAGRFLVEPETDLLSRRRVEEQLPADVVAQVRRAVVRGRQLRLQYAAAGGGPARWRTVDPLGLVVVRGRTYLLATRSGESRTYRLSRVLAAEEQPSAADRPEGVELEALWRQRCEQFLSEDHLTVHVRVSPRRRDDLLDAALAVRSEHPDDGEWLRLEVVYEDLWHAEWALWQLGGSAEALAPPELRAALHARATALAERHRTRDRATTRSPHLPS